MRWTDRLPDPTVSYWVPWAPLSVIPHRATPSADFVLFADVAMGRGGGWTKRSVFPRTNRRMTQEKTRKASVFGGKAGPFRPPGTVCGSCTAGTFCV
jgi:hypothetical protein